MGAFLLYKKNRDLDIERAKEVFAEKGFSAPIVFDYPEYEFLLYKKQLVKEDNYISDGDYTVFGTGTYVYKGLGCAASLAQIAADYKNGLLETEKIRGNYCIVFAENGSFSFLTDAANVQHLFTDREESFITTSFLAAMQAVPGRLTLNRRVCEEKLLLGYTVGSETLFNEIIHLSQSEKEKSGWSFIDHPAHTVPASDGRSKKKNAENRAEKIKEYLGDFDALRKEYAPEIGLSDGYDSRTLYAGILKTWKTPIAVHTHATKNVKSHEEERKTVEAITKKSGSVLTVVPTLSMPDYSEEETDDILKDGLYFFDGRCGRDMGAFSPVYTKKYKLATVKENRFTLNGLGGEVYRRYYLDLKPLISVRGWMRVHVYPEGVEDIIDKKTLSGIEKDLCEKITKELGLKWSGCVSNFTTRRYYSEIVMPDCDALNCNAHNQLEFYVTPFIEWDMVRDAYRSRRALGSSGQLEAKIMQTLDPDVAAFPSHYGFSFTENPPFAFRLKRIIRGIVPNRMEAARVRRIVRKDAGQNEYFEKVRAKSKYLDAATANIERLFPEIRFDKLRRDYRLMPNSVYVSVLLYEFKDRIAPSDGE